MTRQKSDPLPDAGLETTLAAAYAAGRAAGRSRLPAECVDPRIVALGRRLREDSLAAFRDRYAASAPRVFFCFSFPPQRSWWYADLYAALRHAGIPCAWAHHDDPSLATKLEVFAPTVVLAIESARYLESAGRAAIDRYKRRHGCLRILSPPVPARSGDALDPEGAERLARDLAGELCDGHFSPFVAEYYASHFREWRSAGFPYLELPLAFSPFIHFPIDGVKDLDYFMVAGREPHRPAVAVAYLEPVFRRYFGLWAGPAWSFGEGPLEPPETPAYYARARIAPNPLHPGLVAEPADLTQRTFAATACGAFVLTLRTPATARFFAADELIAVDGPQAFLDAFDHFVERPDERNAIVERGLRRVYAEHTYFHRIGDLVRFVEEHAARA